MEPHKKRSLAHYRLTHAWRHLPCTGSIETSTVLSGQLLAVYAQHDTAAVLTTDQLALVTRHAMHTVVVKNPTKVLFNDTVAVVVGNKLRYRSNYTTFQIIPLQEQDKQVTIKLPFPGFVRHPKVNSHYLFAMHSDEAFVNRLYAYKLSVDWMDVPECFLVRENFVWYAMSKTDNHSVLVLSLVEGMLQVECISLKSVPPVSVHTYTHPIHDNVIKMEVTVQSSGFCVYGTIMTDAQRMVVDGFVWCQSFQVSESNAFRYLPTRYVYYAQAYFNPCGKVDGCAVITSGAQHNDYQLSMYEETMQPVWQATFSSHIQNTTHVHKTRLYLDRMTEDVVVAASSYGSVLSAFDYRTGALLWERTFHSNDRVAWYAQAAQLVSATQNDTCTNVSITKFCPL